MYIYAPILQTFITSAVRCPNKLYFRVVLKLCRVDFRPFCVYAFVSRRRNIAGYVTDETWQNNTERDEKWPKQGTSESIKT